MSPLVKLLLIIVLILVALLAVSYRPSVAVTTEMPRGEPDDIKHYPISLY